MLHTTAHLDDAAANAKEPRKQARKEADGGENGRVPWRPAHVAVAVLIAALQCAQAESSPTSSQGAEGMVVKALHECCLL